eukprot:gnl/TRDRNA2_/TRDRNA2_160870_c0_seq1.p1 gnl/TRDRNA2_/TRDRNA2_160870_c0~~gnl/TRDRNA2_/TRDRNA2_160870_c0_seq1.p1  ORF type:complete len:130 (+),score=18.20 gnl/TRDRNA2_/TRDRNA2_160870_c0_seq1:283-672(+)
MRQEVVDALEKWRPAFRFNDQGLWNVLFYHTAAFYPLCLSGPAAGEHSGAPFDPLVLSSLEELGRAIDVACGPAEARRRPMYHHPDKTCLPAEEWERKRKSNKELSDQTLKDISKAYDRAERRKHELHS